MFAEIGYGTLGGVAVWLTLGHLFIYSLLFYGLARFSFRVSGKFILIAKLRLHFKYYF